MRRFAGLLLSAVLVLGACGGEDEAPSPEENPQAAFVSAIEELGEAGSQTITVSLASTAESLAALSEGELAAEDAQKIIDSSLSISAINADDPADSAASFSVNIAGAENAFEMRTIGYDLYLRADVAAIMETFGQNPAQLKPVAQQAAAGGFGWVKNAIDGDWLGIENVNKLAEQFGAPPQGEATEEQKAMIEQFTESLKDTSNVTEEGEDDIGTHLVASFNIRQVYQDFSQLAAGLGGGLAGAGALPPASEVPDENVDVDVWIDDGVLRQAELDFLQFAKLAGEDVPKGVEQLALRITFDEFTGEITAPDGAVIIDPQQILQGMFGGLGGLGGGGMGAGGAGGGGSAAFPCEMLEGEPREVVEQYKEECPELLKKR